MIKLNYVGFCCLLLTASLYRACTAQDSHEYDLTIVGFLNPQDGLGRTPLTIMHALKDYMHINWIETKYWHTNVSLLPEWALEIANEPKTPGTVALITDMLWDSSGPNFKKVPTESYIKYAYSVIESSRIPIEWTAILNQKFDAVIVPDAYYVKTYQDSGVKIPIFVLPPILCLENLFTKELKMNSQRPFVFGNTSATRDYKNQQLLIQAFYKAFGDSPDVKLIMNARAGDEKEDLAIRDLIKKLGVHNIDYKMQTLNWQDYVNTIAAFDCYVNLSKGEGFDIPPYEAFAVGTPVILSKNTAHGTPCKTGLAYCVTSDIVEPAYYSIYGQICGNQFNVSLDDTVAALQEVYNNYSKYLDQALQRRQYASRYLAKNLRKKYLNLVRPLDVRLGNQNIITNDFIMTDSKPLYLKLKTLIPNNLR